MFYNTQTLTPPFHDDYVRKKISHADNFFSYSTFLFTYLSICIYIKSFSYIFHITQLLFNDIHGVFSLKTYLVLHPRLSSKYFIRKFIYYSLCLHLYYYAPHIIYTIIYWEDDKKKNVKIHSLYLRYPRH